MIDFTYAKCDRCAKKHHFQGRMTFHGIVQRIKEMGWSITKKPNGWGHYCPECTAKYKERRKEQRPARPAPAADRQPVRQWWQD